MHALARTLLLLAGLTLRTGLAAAAPGDDKRAEQLFLEGREAATAGDYVTACGRFAASLELVERAGTLLNLADCEDRARHPLAASRFLHRALPLLDPKDERVKFTQNRLADLERRIAHLRFRPDPGLAAGTRFTLAGKPLDAVALQSRVAVEPGDHAVGIEEPGKPPRTIWARVGEGADETVALLPEAPAAGPVPLAPPVEPERDLVAPLVAGGVGVAGLTVFAVTGLMLLSRDADIDAACPDRRCSPEGLDLIDGQGPLFVVNAVGLGVGLVGVGLGAFFLISGASDPGEVAAASVHLHATPTPGGGAAYLGGSF